MYKQNKIEEFLYKGYKDFDVEFCNGALALMWLFSSFFFYLFGNKPWLWGLIFTAINIVFSILLSEVKKQAKFKISRFLFDAVITSYLVLLSTTVTYRIFVLYDEKNNWLLFAFLIVISLLSVFMSSILFYKVIIKKNTNESQKKTGKIYPTTIIFALFGCFLAPSISEAMQTDSESLSIGVLGIIFSVIMSMCAGLSLLKLYLYLKIHNQSHQSGDGSMIDKK